MEKRARLFCTVSGVYGLALSALIFSALVTPLVVGLFVAEPYTLGSHGAIWQRWHGVGCAFAGLTLLLARGWPIEVLRQLTAVAGGLYLIWGLQNLYLMLMTDGFGPLMWLHVLLCLAVGAWGAQVAFELRGQR